MKKLILLFLILLVSIYLVNSETISGSCSIKTACNADEAAVFSLYEQTDSHVRTDLSGRYKLCCPNNKVLIGTKGSNCADPANPDSADLLFKAYNTGRSVTEDAHVSYSINPLPGYTENVCLSLTPEFSGNVQCTIKTSSCDANELGVVSLFQREDSHVGSINDYANKICCSVNFCPQDFYWRNGECIPRFASCLVAEGEFKKITSDSLCQSLWRQPMSQTELYWRDALSPEVQDCFEIDNELACCYATEYLGDTYGKYVENTLIKKRINEIFG